MLQVMIIRVVNLSNNNLIVKIDILEKKIKQINRGLIVRLVVFYFATSLPRL